MEAIADSSALLAAFHVSDSLHERGVKMLATAPKPVLVPEYVAIETSGVLGLRTDHQLAQEFMRVVLETGELRLLRLSPDHFYLAAAYFSQTKRQLSFVDCSLVVLSRDFDVLTFDKALAKAIREEK